MKSIRLLTLILVFFSLNTYSQDWPKIFGGTTYYWSWGLNESYDKGFILDIQVDAGAGVPQMCALLIKTDINGNQIWRKTVSSSFYQIAINGIDDTYDGGIIATGGTTKLDAANFDVVFLKYNSCGEKEWCKVLSTPGNDDCGMKIKQIPDGYIALIHYYQDSDNERIWLFKLDLSGNIIWQQCYLDTDLNVWGEEPLDLMICADSGFLVTGYGWFRNQGNPTWYQRPIFIKTTSDGTQQWVLPFGQTNGFKGDLPTFPNENQSSNYYASARHTRDSLPFGDSPCFLKVSQNGNEVYYKDLITNSISGGSSTLNLKNNDSLFISAAWTASNNIPNIGLFKCDTNGNISKTKILAQNDIYGINEALFTHNNDYLALGTFDPDSLLTKIYLYKFTANLEYSPLDPRPRTYDSLCPHPVVSDTTSLDDCAVITSVIDPFKTPEKFNITVYPNPAKNAITIGFPQWLLRKTSSGSNNISTIYSKWNTATIEIMDLSGKKLFSKEINQNAENVELNVSSWNEGLYIARLLFMSKVVAKSAFVIRR